MEIGSDSNHSIPTLSLGLEHHAEFEHSEPADEGWVAGVFEQQQADFDPAPQQPQQQQQQQQHHRNTIGERHSPSRCRDLGQVPHQHVVRPLDSNQEILNSPSSKRIANIRCHASVVHPPPPAAGTDLEARSRGHPLTFRSREILHDEAPQDQMVSHLERQELNLGRVPLHFPVDDLAVPADHPVATGQVVLNSSGQPDDAVLDRRRAISYHEAVDALVGAEPLISSSAEGDVVWANSTDILFGRGNALKHHEGNVFYRSFIEPYSPQYTNPTATKAEKNAIVSTIINHLTNQGRRFLRPSVETRAFITNPCTVVPDEEIREKIAHGLRERRVAQQPRNSNRRGLRRKQ